MAYNKFMSNIKPIKVKQEEFVSTIEGEASIQELRLLECSIKNEVNIKS